MARNEVCKVGRKSIVELPHGAADDAIIEGRLFLLFYFRCLIDLALGPQKTVIHREQDLLHRKGFSGAELWREAGLNVAHPSMKLSMASS